MRSAARLVPWLPDELLDGFIADYLAIGEPKSPVSNVRYEMAVYTPERLRPFQDQIGNEHVQQGLRSGASDRTVDELTEVWRSAGELDALHQLALVRTGYALDRVRSFREDLDQPTWEMLVELAGGLPDREGRASHQPAFMGFVADAGESPHLVGDWFSNNIPTSEE
ncbi:hypothetical protein [Amycolatopsis taiwanensis]|uniref:hypothetical protein n=1 Tax=Amycolatopsis taiwanensis TaxID=342230 RepID=UPI00048871CC|nr:hypothetical protein [Amycolatopsis taiwanensis]